MTIKLALVVVITGFIGGLILAFLSKTPFKIISMASDGMVYLLRNTPLIMLIAIVHYGFFPSFNIEVDFFASAWVAISLSASAYFSEIFRSGWRCVRCEERESASVLGLSFIQQQVVVILPLMFLRIIPAIANQIVAIIKDTSLAALIGIIEISRATEIIYEQTFREGEMLLFLTVIYFVICYGVTIAGQCIARKKLLTE